MRHLLTTNLESSFPVWTPVHDFESGDVAYLSPYWVEVVSYSPKSRIVRFRRVHETTIRRMSRLRFEKQARVA